MKRNLLLTIACSALFIVTASGQDAAQASAKTNAAKAYLAEAQKLFGTNQPEEALKSFDKLIELEPNNGSNWVGKGQMLEALKRDDEALKAFDKAISLNPTNGTAWNFRGGVLLRSGKYGEAIKSYDRSIEVIPKWADSFYRRACAYARNGDKTNALADLKTAIQQQSPLGAKAAKEDHFKSLRDDPGFKQLLMPPAPSNISLICE